MLKSSPERQPLLSPSTIHRFYTQETESLVPYGRDERREAKSAQVPWLQLSFVAIFRATQPLYFGVVLPFLNAMLVNELQVSDEANVGYWSGPLEGAMPIAMMLGLFLFAAMSDKYGRKWVTLIGVGTSSLFCIAFGFTRNYNQLLLLRFAIGFANSAQGATSKTMVSEICNKDTLARGYTVTSLAWQIGSFVAPLIGGIAAHPAMVWPYAFKGTIFEKYPYALPGVMVAALPCVAVICGIFWFEETHPGLKLKRFLSLHDLQDKAKTEVSVCDTTVTRAPRSVLCNLRSGPQAATEEPGLFSCGLGFILMIWILLVLNICGCGVSEILLFFSSPKVGGLGFNHQQLSEILAIRPLMLCFYESTVFPKLAKRFGPERLLRMLICIWPFHVGCYMALACIVTAGVTSQTLIYGLLGTALVLQMLANPSFIAGDLLISARAPSSKQLAMSVTMGEFVAQISWFVGASGGSALFAKGITLSDDNFMKGKIIWVVALVSTTFTAIVTQRLTKKNGWREKEEEN